MLWGTCSTLYYILVPVSSFRRLESVACVDMGVGGILWLYDYVFRFFFSLYLVCRLMPVRGGERCVYFLVLFVQSNGNALIGRVYALMLVLLLGLNFLPCARATSVGG